MKAANEKCDSVSAAAKDDCLGNAKTQWRATDEVTEKRPEFFSGRFS